MIRSRKVRVCLQVAFLLCLPACVEEMQGSILDDTPANRSGETKKLFIPHPDEIVPDEETGLSIVKNVINVTFRKGTDRSRIDTIIAAVDGKIVGYDTPAVMYQIRFGALDLSAVDVIRARLLGDYPEVEVASRFFVSVYKDPYYVR